MKSREMQWREILGIIRSRLASRDLAYLEQSAVIIGLGVEEVLQRALAASR